MVRRLLLLALTVAVTGCAKPPVEAPAELGELGLYLFANFGNEDPAELIAGISKMEAWMDDHDLDGPVQDRAYAMPVLTEDDWGDIRGVSGADPNDQTPLAAFGVSRHDLDANVALQGETNHVCIESNSTKYYGRTFVSEKGCFLDGTCDFLETSNEVRKESLAAKVWYDLFKDYRVVEDEASGRRVLYSRGWIERQFLADGGNNSWDQLFSLEVWIPDGDRTKRFHAFWSAVTIGSIGDDLYLSQVEAGLDEGYVNADNFIDGELCANDRDRAYDRE